MAWALVLLMAPRKVSARASTLEDRMAAESFVGVWIQTKMGEACNATALIVGGDGKQVWDTLRSDFKIDLDR
jgi:hypothetical protein